MPTTTFVPLKAIQAWYDDDDTGLVAVSLYLLDATAAPQDSDVTVDDLDGLVPSTGAYDASTGIPAGDWPLNWDADAGVLELSLPDAGWASDDTYTVSFRSLAIVLPGGVVLSVVDFGASHTLTGQPLEVHADESDDIANSYPVFRWRKG